MTWTGAKKFLEDLNDKPHSAPQVRHVLGTGLCTSHCFKVEIAQLHIRTFPEKVYNKLFSNL